MRLLRNASIAKKLSMLTILAVSVSLSLCAGAFLYNDVSSLRKAKHQQIESLARVLGQNAIAPLEFDDRLVATETLGSLSSQPGVEVAVLYDSHGDVFATYPADLQPDEFGENAGYLEVDHQIDVQAGVGPGEMMGDIENLFNEGAETGDAVPAASQPDAGLIGRLVIRANTRDISAQIAQRTMVAGAVLIGSLLIGVSISWHFRRSITVPVADLVTAARHVAGESDYTYRVAKHGEDELGVLSDAFNGMLSDLESNRQQLQQANEQLEQRVQERTAELAQTNSELQREMTEREQLQEELITASRQAGMAEVATGVLHNVGNVLNSINVSAHLIVDKLQASKVPSLGKACDLLNQHEDDLAGFFTSDERGARLPRFLMNLATHLSTEREEQQREMQSLIENIEHVKEIVSTQQNYARVRGATESLDVLALVRDAIQINDAALSRQGVTTETDFIEVRHVIADKHKILQILVNLIGNARQALAESDRTDQKLTLTVEPEGDMVSVCVRDNGIGIASENLKKIFSHGFTTKKEGHGFGLHSSALAAQELGGSLSVHSDGVGSGAAFTLRLPAAVESAGVS